MSLYEQDVISMHLRAFMTVLVRILAFKSRVRIKVTFFFSKVEVVTLIRGHCNQFDVEFLHQFLISHKYEQYNYFYICVF